MQSPTILLSALYTGLTKSTSGGQITVGIGAGAVDLDRIKSDDIVATSAYSSTWTNEDDKIVTAGALAARHDVVVNTDVNPPSTAQAGKQWLSTAPGNQVHKIYDGSGWRTVAVGQPFSPATTTIVRYVDSTNGSDASDVTGFLPQAPLQSIGRALELINASSSGDGSLIKVAPGVYQETLPLRIKKNNISIVGESMRSCFVHPTVATENNDMFEVDSGSYIANLTLLGLKVPTADQGSRNNSLDNDATYGLPSNQPFSVRFRTDTQPTILKSPYIQNCTHFSDAHFDNANFDPNTFPSTDAQTYSAVAGDQTSAPCGGGLLVDGSAVSSSSPIRSMVVDAFTQITLDGPGVLVTNNGYAQLVSFFGTFAHYHAKAKNGGQINLSNCVSDFGRYGLIADGKSPSAIATATASAANSGATTITIGAITTAGSFHGTVSRPLDHMMVTIDGVDYGVVSSTANGAGWDIVLTSGLTSNITNTTVSFALRSYISTGGHTFEFVGVGTDYGDHPDNGGVPVEANQVIELNGGKVWQSSTDHVGKFKAGNVLVVNQVSETVDLKATTVTGNLAVTGTVDGRDVAADGTKLDGIAAGAEVNVNADWNASSGDAQILNKPTIPAAYTNSDVDAHLNQSTAASGEVLSWNGSDYDWVAQSGGGGSLANIVEDTTPQLGGNLDVNGNDIVSVSNGDIDLDPNGSGVVVFKGNATKGSGQLKLNCEQNSHGVTIKGPPHSAAASYTLTLPNTDGNANELLKTDGSGNLSWVADSGASEINDLSDAKTANSGALIGIGTGALANNTSATSTSLAIGLDALNDQTTGTHNVAIGNGALSQLTTGHTNVAVGRNAGANATSGTTNVFVGMNAGKGASSGGSTSNTVAIGEGAYSYFTSANDGTAIGWRSLRFVTTGHSNTALGYQAGDAVTTGTNNLFMGHDAGTTFTTGSNCTAIGHNAQPSSDTVSNEITLGDTNVTSLRIPGLQSGASDGDVLTYNSTNGNITLAAGGLTNNASGSSNLGLLSAAADSVTTGFSIIGIGQNALTAVTGSNKLIAIGSDACKSLTLGSGITALGHDALESATGTNYTVAIGNSALTNQNGGLGNTAVGHSSMQTSTSGSNNTAVGGSSLYSKTSAGGCTAVGGSALYSLTNASDTVGIGASAGYNTTTGTDNTYVGSSAGLSVTTATSNVCIGNDSGYSLTTASENVSIGHKANYSRTTSGQSVAIGYEASYYPSSWHTVAIGYQALKGAGAVAAGAFNNTAVGYQAGTSVSNLGQRNVFMGYLSGSSVTTGAKNVTIGSRSGLSLTTGSANTVIGFEAASTGSGQLSTGSNNVIIGNEAMPSSSSASNEVTLGDSNIATLRCNTQTISSLSDGRDKTEVEDLPLGLDFIDTLRPVKFKWDTRDGNGKDGSYEAGFIAQDLQSAQSTSDAEYLNMVMDSNPDRLEAAYGQLIPVLVQAIKDLKSEIETLKSNV